MSAQLIAWLQTQGADVQTDVHDGGHELRNTELTALTRLFGGQF